MWRLVASTFILMQYLTNYVTDGEIFSSTARVTKLYTSTNGVISVLDNYIRKEEERINSLKRIREDIVSLSELQDADDVRVPEHPVGAYNIIHTYYNLYNSIELATKDRDDFETDLLRKSVTLPTVRDYQGASLAMLRLQDIYQLESIDLINGNVKNRRMAQLSRADAYMIGQQTLLAYRFRKYRAAWLAAALVDDGNDSEQEETFPKKSAYLNLAKEYLQSFQFDEAIQCINRSRELYPYDVEITSAYHEIKERVDHLKTNGVDLASQSVKFKDFQWYSNYSALCRGDASMVKSDVSSSYCTWSPSSLPYNRVKMEVLSLEPYIVMYHDVITDSEAKYLRQRSLMELKRGKVGGNINGTISNVRVGQLTWLRDDHYPQLQKLSQRVMTITGLDVTTRDNFSSSEPFQVVNYGIGGHYEPHLDVYDDPKKLANLPKHLRGTGDRLATFLFYLDEVVEGGATVFPKVGIRVPPVKNSAAFWYNIRRSGTIDPLALHAGCPVLLGQKWIANKWFREYGQEFRHPCGLTPDAPSYT